MPSWAAPVGSTRSCSRRTAAGRGGQFRAEVPEGAGRVARPEEFLEAHRRNQAFAGGATQPRWREVTHGRVNSIETSGPFLALFYSPTPLIHTLWADAPHLRAA